MTTDRDALRQAGEWFALLCDETVSAEDRAAWQHWLEARPEHRRAWQQVEAVGQRFRRLRSEADRSAAEATLDTLRGRRVGRRQALKQLSLLLGTGALGWAAWRHGGLAELGLAWTADHRTGVGEIAEIALSDGSRLWLNTDSAVNRDYRSDQRRLQLVRGEILIETAAERRPLRVDTAHGRLEALGTRFAVRDGAAQTRLAVYDGAVAIRPTAGARQVIDTGQRTHFTAEAIAPPRPADPAAAAWTRGELVAEHLPLGELVAELARYRHGRLVVAPEVADLTVMGVYPLTDTDRALAMLEQTLPIRVRRVLPWWVRVEPR